MDELFRGSNYPNNIEDMSQAAIAYEVLRNAILDLRLTPGQLLSETELAKELNMSRTPVREAIQRLNNEELVDIVPRKGTFVKVHSNEEIYQIYETAEGLEGMVAFLAAQRANYSGIKQLEIHIFEMENSLASKDIERWIICDENFHATLQQLCGNRYLIEALSRLYNQIHWVRLMTRRLVNKTNSTQDHKNVFQAIKNGKSEEARQLTQNHWQRIRDVELKVLFPTDK